MYCTENDSDTARIILNYFGFWVYGNTTMQLSQTSKMVTSARLTKRTF